MKPGEIEVDHSSKYAAGFHFPDKITMILQLPETIHTEYSDRIPQIRPNLSIIIRILGLKRGIEVFYWVRIKGWGAD